MPLVSNLFRDNPRLQDCLVSDPAHVTPGNAGEHVRLIQLALIDLDDAEIAAEELESDQYGPSTAAAVLAFKKARAIINRAYQSTPDNIVGKMTIKVLDDEMFAGQETPAPGDRLCNRIGGPVVRPRRRRAPVRTQFNLV